jgi:hypothetical protein
MRKILALLCALALATPGFAGPIAGYPAATLPYNPSDAVIGTQGSVTKQFTMTGIAGAVANTSNVFSQPQSVVCPSAITQCLATSQIVSGTAGGNCGDALGITYPCANLFYISSEGADGSSFPAYDDFQFRVDYAASMKGLRQAVDVLAIMTHPSSNSANTGYGASAFEFYANVNDGGLTGGINNGRGSAFGENPVVVLGSGATFWFGAVPSECNVNINTGASAYVRFCYSAVNGSGGALQALLLPNDAAFHVGNQLAGGAWHQAFNMSDLNGAAPLDSTGCVICNDGASHGIGTGIDFSSYTIPAANPLIKGANGFSVGGAGVIHKAQVIFANLATVDPSPVVGDELVITDASACTANAAVTTGGGTVHACPVIYTGSQWLAPITH